MNPLAIAARRFVFGLALLAPLVGRAEALHQGDAPTGAAWKAHVVDGSHRNPDGVRAADIDADGRIDLVTGWEAGGATRVYLHPGPHRVREPWPGVTVGATPNAEDALFVDLDDDGVFDVVTSTEGDDRRVYVHWGPRDPSPILDPEAWRQDRFAAVDGLIQSMFAIPLDIDGRNGIDLVLGGKNDDRSIPSFLGWLESPTRPRDVDAWRWHPLASDVSWVMSIHSEDVDADGDPDIVYGDKHGEHVGIHWLENPGRQGELDAPWRRHGIPIRGVFGTSFSAVADLDGDGLRDLLISATLRDGKAADAPKRHAIVVLRKLDDSGDRWEQHEIEAPARTGSPKGLSVGDVDLDGRLDLVVSCSGAEGDLVGVYWLSFRNDVFDRDWVAHDISGPIGTKFDLVPLLDADGDGDLDVFSTEEKEYGEKGLGVVWYENPARSPHAPQQRDS